MSNQVRPDNSMSGITILSFKMEYFSSAGDNLVRKQIQAKAKVNGVFVNVAIPGVGLQGRTYDFTYGTTGVSEFYIFADDSELRDQFHLSRSNPLAQSLRTAFVDHAKHLHVLDQERRAEAQRMKEQKEQELMAQMEASSWEILIAKDLP